LLQKKKLRRQKKWQAKTWGKGGEKANGEHFNIKGGNGRCRKKIGEETFALHWEQKFGDERGRKGKFPDQAS